MRGLGWMLLVLGLLGGSSSLGLGWQDGGTSGGGKSSGSSEAKDKQALCNALCAYANATGKNTGGLDERGNPITPEARKLAAKNLERELRKCVSKGANDKTGNCTCTDPEGNEFRYSYRIEHRGGDSGTMGSEDIVISIGGDKNGPGSAGNAKAVNTGDGDALAFGGSNMGAGDGGSAEATAGSGDSFAEGGDATTGMGGAGTATSDSGTAVGAGGASGSQHPGGMGAGVSTSGTAVGFGGQGGNAGHSASVPGGKAGVASATYSGSPATVAGFAPVPVGQHGYGSKASASHQDFSIHGGWFTPN